MVGYLPKVEKTIVLWVPMLFLCFRWCLWSTSKWLSAWWRECPATEDIEVAAAVLRELAGGSPGMDTDVLRLTA